MLCIQVLRSSYTILQVQSILIYDRLKRRLYACFDAYAVITVPGGYAEVLFLFLQKSSQWTWIEISLLQ